MDIKVEEELSDLINNFDQLIPSEQLQEMKDLNSSGEPGIAYENLCTQIFEFDIKVSETRFSQIRQIGLAIGLAPKYWERIRPEF